MPKPIHNQEVDFDFLPRTIEVLNYFFTDSLAFPSSLEKVAVLLILPLLAVFAWIFFKRKEFSDNPLLKSRHLWLPLVLAIYVAEIVYAGLNNPASRTIGFMRFYYLTQPVLIAILLLMLKNLNQYKSKSALNRIFQYGLVALLAVSALLSTNRTRLFFQNQHTSYDQSGLYMAVEENISAGDVLLSNHWAAVSINTGKPCGQIGGASDTKQRLASWKTPYKEAYLVLFKDIGVTYRQGAPVWNETLEKLPSETVFENEKAVLVKVGE